MSRGACELVKKYQMQDWTVHSKVWTPAVMKSHCHFKNQGETSDGHYIYTWVPTFKRAELCW